MPAAAPVRAYVGLGSNLAGPAAQLARAFAALVQLAETQVLARSPLYISRPLGPPDQPEFLNGVAALATGLPPLDLLRALQAIEAQQGRKRDGQSWGPRTLDLDILLYGDLTLNTPELTLPHPGVSVRSFVLYPLADLAPGLIIPGRGTVAELKTHCEPLGIRLYKENTHG